MDTPGHFGNQMKAPLAVHPKTGKRACILRPDGTVMGIEESLDFLVEFAKKLPDAKPIEFEITKEIEQKYSKPKMSEEFKAKLKAKGVQKYCKFLEEVACKREIPSVGEINRHSHIDKPAYLYAKSNNRPELLEAYKSMQGREDSAFNQADEWAWSCKSIVRFIDHYKD